MRKSKENTPKTTASERTKRYREHRYQIGYRRINVILSPSSFAALEHLAERLGNQTRAVEWALRECHLPVEKT